MPIERHRTWYNGRPCRMRGEGNRGREGGHEGEREGVKRSRERKGTKEGETT